eukprot:COSAG02_NODE_6827_length_3340_cov_3.187905_3_plen_101_part_00
MSPYCEELHGRNIGINIIRLCAFIVYVYRECSQNIATLCMFQDLSASLVALMAVLLFIEPPTAPNRSNSLRALPLLRLLNLAQQSTEHRYPPQYLVRVCH